MSDINALLIFIDHQFSKNNVDDVVINLSQTCRDLSLKFSQNFSSIIPSYLIPVYVKRSILLKKKEKYCRLVKCQNCLIEFDKNYLVYSFCCKGYCFCKKYICDNGCKFRCKFCKKVKFIDNDGFFIRKKYTCNYNFSGCDKEMRKRVLENIFCRNCCFIIFDIDIDYIPLDEYNEYDIPFEYTDLIVKADVYDWFKNC